jgi:hypothetical protein
MKKIVFLNSNQAKSGELDRYRFPVEYVATARFFGCGIIDRTRMLDHGFDFRVLDAMPPADVGGALFADICNSVAADIVTQALEKERPIRMFWSGGIDSTTALVALMQAADQARRRDLIRIAASLKSIQEYPLFFTKFIRSHYPVIPVAPPVSRFLNPNAVNVTGELGDQLFGNELVRPYIGRGLATMDYQDALPLVLVKHLGDTELGERTMRYLQPQLTACPVEISSLFDALWWMNFSLKWQQISLRFQVFKRRRVREADEATIHFFQDQRFQAWSLGNPRHRACVDDWRDYKKVAKRYIFSFTNDRNYCDEKVKQSSMRPIIVPANKRIRYRHLIAMDEEYRTRIRMVRRKGRMHDP